MWGGVVKLKSVFSIVFLFFIVDHAFAIDPVYEGANGIRENVFATNCLSCHSSEVSGPDRNYAPDSINFDTYEATILNVDVAISEVNVGAMPPADSGIPLLNADQKTALIAWQNAGFPRAAAAAPPAPLISPNGSSLTISLVAGAGLGKNADWWVVAYTPWGHWYYYVYPNVWKDIGTDLGGALPAYQGPLANISSLALFDVTGLPSGKYVIYFGVDTSMNGLLDYNQLYYSSFQLNAP